MIVMDRTSKNAELRVVEKPSEIVPRLGRLEADDATLIEQLTQLGVGSLQRITSLTEKALVRLGGNNGEEGRSDLAQSPRVISRSSDFGD